jgi:hypothetical protein
MAVADPEESLGDVTEGPTVRGEEDPQPQAVAEPEPEPEARVLPERIGGRYAVQGELGRGGMAVVYRVIDTVSSRELALKQLTASSNERYFNEQAAAFEREFHTLMQLAHPRIIEVYDFGTDEHGRYYTMELLDGADMRERSPLPWQEACSLIYDVCSSLALLHSRRLVHRDISPRNIRSAHDGRAKLIDFGALVPMGATGHIVGTPPFLPPEVLHRSMLDARTDLFSLGATLYYTLTGRLAFPARDFSRLQQVWANRPAPPSACTPGIPAALDALVMSLISLDPELRPRTAFDVMQRLAAIAGIDRVETEDVFQAYVSTPVMVGREQALATLRQQIELGVGGGKCAVLIQGPSGIGRSRLLDACAMEAKIRGASVLRFNASSGTDVPFAVGQALAAQLVEALPDAALASARDERVTERLFVEPVAGAGGAVGALPVLKDLTGRGGDRPAIQSAITRWLLRVAKAHPLAILIDDLPRLDEASLALLGALALGPTGRRLALLVTTDTDAPAQTAEGFNVLLRDCTKLELAALSREQIEALLNSVFGDVPNLALTSERLYSAAGGNPRETMELVQSLITQGIARYAGGRWLLPERLEAEALPSSAAESCRRRVAELSPLARSLAELNALALHPRLSREDYARAAGDVTSAALDAAITELLSRQILAGDASGYVLARREWPAALLASLDATVVAERHRALAQVYAKEPVYAVECSYHLLAGGLEAAGLEQLAKLLVATSGDVNGLSTATTIGTERLATILDYALSAAERLRWKPRELADIRRALLACSTVADEAHYYRAAPAWFAQLAQDSGLAHYRTISDAPNANERLMRALTQAGIKHAATPEQERVYNPEEAIKGLVYYVAVSIAVGSRTQNGALLASLPEALEPFAALSPAIRAMWQNSIATRETNRDNLPEAAHKRWLEVDAELAKISSKELSYVAALRGAIAYGIVLIEARLGFTSAEARARTLENDRYQRVSGLTLRRIARLHQGDFEGAERFRKQAELLALQANQRQMFSSTIPAVLIAYALASDLAGIRETMEAIEPLAARFPGWVAYKHMAQGFFEQTRGQPEAACEAFERGLAIAEPDPDDPSRSFGAWPRLEGAYIEALVSLGRHAEAKAHGERALQIADQLGVNAPVFVVKRALALAEAKLGAYELASRRLEALIDELTAMGISGLELGATCEARARIAIWAGDQAAIERYGRMTAKQYRHAERSPLGARYERLMDEARSSGAFVLPELTEFQTKLTTMNWRNQEQTATVFRDAITGTQSAGDRAERALRLLCEARGARSGYLYLCQPGGFELAASRGGSTPDAELPKLLARVVAQQVKADECATMIETADSPLTTSRWLDSMGITHHFTLLMSETRGARVCVGVAVIEWSVHTTSTAGERHLLTEIADELLRVGDASGVADAR